ncbi:DUF3667 domain-containing protein [Maribacter chungangensis]|uniref:DUF3667 domain-containing protein n=1 Tax=Maribacter chungangensis TaxID=1069117 RepID=A0ABW3B7D7_9FLAO
MKLSLGNKKAGRYRLKYRGVTCLNCKHPLDISDKFCPNCSQANSTKRLTLKDFFEEFFSSLFSYDTKLFKTLAAMLTRPGKITKDYLAGKRVSYTNPFRFLLSLAIIYFLLMGFSGSFEQLNRLGEDTGNGLININTSALKNIDFGEAEKDKDKIISELDSLDIDGVIYEQVRLRDSVIYSNPKREIEAADELKLFPRFFRKLEIYSTLITKDTLYTFAETKDKYDLKNTIGNKTAFTTAKGTIRSKKEPGTFINALISKLPFTTFFFLPVFTVFIWLIYIRKKHTYTDHLIFSFHNQSLLFILLIISYLINSLFKAESNGIFLLIFAIYLYKSMRNFYGQGRFKTIVKYSILNTVFVILACIGVVLLLAGSIFTY